MHVTDCANSLHINEMKLYVLINLLYVIHRILVDLFYVVVFMFGKTCEIKN